MLPMKEPSPELGHLIILGLDITPVSTPPTDEGTGRMFIPHSIRAAPDPIKAFRFHQNVFDSHHWVISHPASFLFSLSSSFRFCVLKAFLNFIERIKRMPWEICFVFFCGCFWVVNTFQQCFLAVLPGTSSWASQPPFPHL